MGLRTLLLGFLVVQTAMAQLAPAVAARQWREANERAILDEFVSLLRINNDGMDPPSMRRNAEAIASIFERRGVDTRLLEIEGAPPVVYGELLTPETEQTLVFYAHYDGMPVEPSEWHTGDPFRPVLMSGALETGGQPIPLPNPGWPSDPEWRLYARSAADDKAVIVALAVALEALRSKRIPLQSNIKFFFDGEKEVLSPHLGQALKEHGELLNSDLWLFCDGPVYKNRQQQIVFGARGFAGLELTVYGPRRELHSGEYGNWAPNPALMLARLLASLKDESGQVLVEGFYDDVAPLGEAEKQAISEAPNFDAAMMRELWLVETEGDGRRLDEAINLPSLNIRGIAAAAVEEDARDIIPATAKASLDIRLVKGMDHQAIVERFIEHIRQQGFHVIEVEPGEEIRLAHPRVCKIVRRPGYNAMRTSMDLDISKRVIAAVERARGPAVKLPTLGSSFPLQTFDEILGAPVIIVPIANHDCNEHSHNENIRLQNLWDGIETMAALLAMEGPTEELPEQGEAILQQDESLLQ